MRRLAIGLTVTAVAVIAAFGLVLVLHARSDQASREASAPAPSRAPAPGPVPGSVMASNGSVRIRDECVAVPHVCGLPDATNTGVPGRVVLRSVPGQVSSGPGWRYNPVEREVDVTGEGAVLSGLSVQCNVNISASRVTITNDRVVTGGFFGISLRNTAGVTIEHSTISGLNATSGRVAYAVDDIYENSTGLVIKDDNISHFSHGVQVSSGTVTGNYIHDPGYIPGDHIDGIFDPGTTHSLMISYNTILNGLGQTAAISLDASATGQAVANKTVVDNLLGGGGYVIYGGAARNDRISHIVIKDNRFSQAYFPKSGQYGPVAYFVTRGKGNAWAGNIWDSSGRTVTAP
jgi:Right handed beta helix region